MPFKTIKNIFCHNKKLFKPKFAFYAKTSNKQNDSMDKIIINFTIFGDYLFLCNKKLFAIKIHVQNASLPNISYYPFRHSLPPILL
jgi:hypothetical protein